MCPSSRSFHAANGSPARATQVPDPRKAFEGRGEGISQASFVETDEQFKERVQFIHTSHDCDVIAEEYIAGREALRQRPRQPQARRCIRSANWFSRKCHPTTQDRDLSCQVGRGSIARSGAAKPVRRSARSRARQGHRQTCKRIYRLLTIDGYARVDLRVTPANEIYFIETNPNPSLAADEDFAQSALKAGPAYPQLIERIIRTGLKTVRE